MSEEEKFDLVAAKIKKGIILSSKKFLKEAKKQNQKLVVMRNNKMVIINARDIK
jgi:hypothetical protein